MPNGWVHATIDLVTFGRPYFDLHRTKDWASRTLGSAHRLVDHDWYHAFGTQWTYADPFPACVKDSIASLASAEGPDAAERHQAWLSHDLFDRTWDDLPLLERKYWEGFFLWLLLNPAILKQWAGVDVLEGRIRRLAEGRETWEACPELKQEYVRLRAYAQAVRGRDPALRTMLASCD